VLNTDGIGIDIFQAIKNCSQESFDHRSSLKTSWGKVIAGDNSSFW
jgi:isocitrate dehydrogenase